jgi:TonB family protein
MWIDSRPLDRAPDLSTMLDWERQRQRNALLAAEEDYRHAVQAAVGTRVRDGHGAAGSVRVVFALGSDGRVLGARILVSSGIATLDVAAQIQVEGAHYPPHPRGFVQNHETVIAFR